MITDGCADGRGYHNIPAFSSKSAGINIIMSVFRGGLPPPGLLYRISTIRSAEKCLITTYTRPQSSSLVTLITLNSAFKHISFINTLRC